MLSFFNQHIKKLNDSKFFAGIVMLMLNVGSKYVSLEFSKTQEEYLRLSLARELLIFAVVWMGTHDIYMSIVMTAAFVILADYLLNEKSQFCILSGKFKKLEEVLDSNQDNFISEEEIQNALDILRKAKKQKNRQVQLDMLSYMDINK